MISKIFKAILPIMISAAGGAFMVFCSYDDSPGGSLIGLLMIIGAVFIASRYAMKKDSESFK